MAETDQEPNLPAPPERVVTDPHLADALVSAYGRVRKSPHDPDARFELARLLVRTPRRDLVHRHVDRLVKDAPQDWPHTTALGVLLFRIGQHEDAYHVLRGCLRSRQINAEALYALSALAKTRGREGEARRAMIAACWMQPVVVPGRFDQGKPIIMRIRSMENSSFDIVSDKRRNVFTWGLRGGHFSTRHLMESSRYNLVLASVCGDNLDGYDEFPPVHLIVNSVACPDLKPNDLREMERLLPRVSEIPVINHPSQVLKTTRAANCVRLGALEGVRFPRTEAFPNDTSLANIADRIEQAGFAYPIILRRAGSQTGMSVARVDNRREAMEALAEIDEGESIYAIEYIDGADKDGLYHKTRAFFIDGTFYPVAHLTNDEWQIHSGDRYQVMSSNPATQTREQAYLSDPKAFLGDRAWQALHRIGETIALDFFGIDFTIDREGDVLVFEANAAMRHNFDHANAFPYTRPPLEAISRAFDEMIARRLEQHYGSG